jgi:hypothetical protein
MAKHIQISVENPCHENWENMSPVEKGRFCGSCQKQVIDFTGMTDAQVAAFFKKPSTGSVCGRFMGDQLERNIELPRKRIPWIKYFFTVALPAFLVSRSAAQETRNIVRKDATVVCSRPPGIMGKINPNKARPVVPKTIKGFILDSKGNPVEGAYVMLKGTKIAASANEYGYFNFENVAPEKGMVLVGMALGYLQREITIDPQKGAFEIIMGNDKDFLGEVVVMGFGIATKSKKIPLIEELLPDSTAKFAKAFPNPVIAGDPLTIQCKKMAKGDYIIELLNASGQMVQHSETRIDHEKHSLHLNTPLVRPGTYYLKITNKVTKKSITDKLVIL